MFEEYGKPDDANLVIVGAHSGYGSNAYFNDIEKLNKNDDIKIIYKDKCYLYEVISVFSVDESNTGILEEELGDLMLMTCKVSDDSKRTIVISKLKLAIWHMTTRQL